MTTEETADKLGLMLDVMGATGELEARVRKLEEHIIKLEKMIKKLSKNENESWVLMTSNGGATNSAQVSGGAGGSSIQQALSSYRQPVDAAMQHTFPPLNLPPTNSMIQAAQEKMAADIMNKMYGVNKKPQNVLEKLMDKLK